MSQERQERSGCVVLVGSLIIPGLGQLIQGRLAAGFSFFIAAFLLWSILWIQFFTVMQISLNDPGAVLVETTFLESALVVGRNLSICLIHLWSLADAARWKGD